MAIVVNGPGTPGPEGPQGPTGPAGTLSANTGISVGGTLSMSGHIVPTVTNTYNLGDTAAYFQDLYIGTGSIIMMSTDGKAAKLSMDSDGELKFERQNRVPALALASSVVQGFRGTTTKFTASAVSGDKGTTGSTGCGIDRNYKFGGMTVDEQGLYAKGKFWTIDNAGDAGATFMNFDSIIINNWEDEHCNRNFCYRMNALPYCARIDIFPQGFSGGNQPWARFFYAGHFGVGGCTQSGNSAGYHRFDIDTNHPIHTMNSPSGGSAAFIVDDEYELRFFPMCSGDSDTDDGASGGSGGSSGGDDGGGGTVDPPAPEYPCITRKSQHRYQGFTLENGIGNLKGYFALGGPGASGANAGFHGGAIVSINSITEMYVGNFSGPVEGFINDNAFLSNLNQNGRVTITRNNGASSDTWARYNYSAIGVSGGTGDGGYVRFTGMTLDTFGPDGTEQNTTLRTDRSNNLCFEDIAVTGPTASLGTNQFSFHYKVGTGDSKPGTGFFKLGTTGAEDSLRDSEFLYLDNLEENGEYGTGRYIGDFMDTLDNSGTITITPHAQVAGQQWVKYFYTTQVQGITSEGGSAGYHKVLGLSAMHAGNWNGNSFGSGIQSGYATGPFMIEFNDSVAQTEWEYINIQGPRDFAETGLAYSVLEKGYPVTIESMRGRLGTGGGCTGTFYRNAMQSNPVPGISGARFRNGGYIFHYASTAGNTFSGGNTLAADETLFLNLTGFTLSGSTGNPNYFSGYVKFRRTDGS